MVVSGSVFKGGFAELDFCKWEVDLFVSRGGKCLLKELIKS